MEEELKVLEEERRKLYQDVISNWRFSPGNDISELPKMWEEKLYLYRGRPSWTWTAILMECNHQM